VDRDDSRLDVLLAVALGSRRKRTERRMLPDRRSGVDRRQALLAVGRERRAAIERREDIRRQEDRDEGATLLKKARSRLSVRSRRSGATST
jgi:hypothetical protein